MAFSVYCNSKEFTAINYKWVEDTNTKQFIFKFLKNKRKPFGLENLHAFIEMSTGLVTTLNLNFALS